MSICENCAKCKKKAEKMKLFNEGKKMCRHCKQIKNLKYFDLHNPKKNNNKYRPDCKACRKIKNKQYYEKKKKSK